MLVLLSLLSNKLSLLGAPGYILHMCMTRHLMTNHLLYTYVSYIYKNINTYIYFTFKTIYIYVYIEYDQENMLLVVPAIATHSAGETGITITASFC